MNERSSNKMTNDQLDNVVVNARKIGAIVLACIPFPNPKDYFLAKVLCKCASDEYVVWTFNYADGGFHNGHYFQDLSNAIEKLNELIIELGYQ